MLHFENQSPCQIKTPDCNYHTYEKVDSFWGSEIQNHRGGKTGVKTYWVVYRQPSS